MPAYRQTLCRRIIISKRQARSVQSTFPGALDVHVGSRCVEQAKIFLFRRWYWVQFGKFDSRRS